MGACASSAVKEGELEAAEEKYTAAIALIHARETELSNTEARLKASDESASKSSSEASILRNQVQNFEAKYADRYREHLKQLNEVQTRLAQACAELEAQKALTRSTRRELDDVLEKSNGLEVGLSSAESELTRLQEHQKGARDASDSVVRGLEAAIIVRDQKLQDAASDMDRLQSIIRILEQEKRSLVAANNVNIEFGVPIRYSVSPSKDQRIEYKEWKGEMRVDIREWYPGGRTRKGVSIPVEDARELASILPHVVAEAARVEARQSGWR